ncbi:MAG: hypothetical protein JRH11_16250 [Deltaproteobacteria bacterium]|nr:hypothetical protein [Deltaproteobacteria bacterium]
MLVASLGAGGCSLVVDPGRHQGGDGGAVDSGVGDSGAADAGADTDADHCDRDFGSLDAEVSGPLVRGSVCPELARVICAGRITQGCCLAAVMAGETAEDCQAALLDSCNRTIGHIVQEPNAAYNQACGGVLLDQAAAMAASCDPAILDLLIDRAGLLDTLDGVLEDGERCEALFGNVAVKAVTAAFTCKRGMSCRRERLLTPLICEPLSDTSTPSPACDGNYDCKSGLRCDRALRLCANRHSDELICESDTDCASLLCDTTCQERTSDSAWCNDPFGLLTPAMD